jgi:hypothetical protein
MGSTNSPRSVRKTVSPSKRKKLTPEIFIDYSADFASIKLAPGVESRSYLKDGFLFCEDKNGKIIEIQVLNLSELAKRKPRQAA